MKKLLLMISLILSINIQAKTSCTLKDGMSVNCYSKRKAAILRIGLMHYGEYMSLADLDRVALLLKNRFAVATKEYVEVDIKIIKRIPLRHLLPIDTTYEFNGITEIERLRRIWYYENVGVKVIKEAFEEFKKNISKSVLNHLDALLIISEAQFDALGFASGRVGITENPMEIAWAAPDQGRVQYVSDYQIVDELIHELGHIMFLGHTSGQCFKPGMSYREKLICCEKSPSKNDVLSYCRRRKNVNEVFFHRFEECNLKMIKEKIVPAMLNGGRWNIEGRSVCR